VDNAAVRTLNRDDNLGEWVGSDLFAIKTIGNHLVTVGMEHRWQFTQHLHNYDVAPPAAGPDLNHRSLVQGYYLQDEYHILKELILNAGLRFDHYENFGSTVNPRAALIWKPRNTTVLRLTYGEAFRAPNAYELYYDDNGASQKGNPDLKPEKVRTVELGWDQFIGENIRTSFSGFYTRISDLIEQVSDTDSLLVFMNQSRVESMGIELLAEGKWENGVSGRLSYSYQNSKNLGSGQPVANSPRNMVKGALTAPLPLKKSFATLETIYTSSRLNANRDEVAGAAIFNLTLLNRDLLKGLDLSASVYNLFDTRYAAPSGPEHINSLGETLREIPQDGITFRIKATYRF
jgi:iron complex outermembrane receptor protein